MIRQFLAHRTHPRIGYGQCVQKICLANLSLVLAHPEIILSACRSSRLVALVTGTRALGQYVEIPRDEFPLALVIGYAPKVLKKRLSFLWAKSLAALETTECSTGLTLFTCRYQPAGERVVCFATITGLFGCVDFLF